MFIKHWSSCVEPGVGTRGSVWVPSNSTYSTLWKQQVPGSRLDTTRSEQTVLHQGANVASERWASGWAFFPPQWYAMCWEHGRHGGSCWCLCFTFCVYGAHSTWAGRESTSYQALNTKTTNSVLLVMCTEFHSLVFVTVKLQFILISICGSVL